MGEKNINSCSWSSTECNGMEKFISDVSSLAANDQLWNILPKGRPGAGYEVDEDCDLYGFSCLAASKLKSASLFCNNLRNESLVDIFRNDENWHNPGALDLMMKSYGLDKSPHLSVTLSEIARKERPSVESFNFMEVKLSQYRMISDRKIDEAVIAMQKSQVAVAIQLLSDAIKLDKENVNSFYLRAKSYMALNEYSHALEDIKCALELTPDTSALLDLRSAIEQKLELKHNSGSCNKIKLLQSAREPNGFTETHNYIPDNHSVTIEKLRSSLKSENDGNGDSASSNFQSSCGSEIELIESDDSSNESRARKSKRRRYCDDVVKKDGLRKAKHSKSKNKRHKERKSSKRKYKKKSRNDVG